MSKNLSNDEYNSGLIRIYYEIICAYNSLNAYNDLSDSINRLAVYPNEFIAQCHFALFDNCLSHLVKVIVDNNRSFSFQNVIKHDRQKIQVLLQQNKIKMKFYNDIQKKLKKLRNKHLAHIDKEYLDDPNRIWDEIKITGDDLRTLINGVYYVVKQLYLNEISRNPKYVEYDDKSILEFIEKNYQTN